MVTLDLHPHRRTLRGFARLWFPLFVVVLGSVLRWRFDLPTAATAAWVAGGALAVAAIASEPVARAVFVSTVLLALMFFAVMTPLGWWLRRRGHDPLRLRGRAAASHWVSYEQDDDPRRAVRQF
jgi:hypothetical protein